MSVSSLPEWKQLLLERKRREEEERDRREREEEERLLSMPAWKRGIIQRRRAAKQEGPGGDRDEKERGDVGDVESYMFSPTGGSGGTGGGCDVIATAEPERPRIELQPLRSFGRVYMENIGPVHQNVFIRSQNSVRRGRLDSDKSGDEQERGGSDGERTGGNVRDERVRGRDVDVKAERYRDRSEGRERDRSAGRERDWSLGRVDSVKGGRAGEGDRDNMRIAKDTQREADFTHHMPGLRTIKAENIIIIEKDRRGNGSEREENDREKLIVEREREVVETEDEEKEEGGERGGKGMRMDLREILAGAGCVTEIRATEVLIIKPGTDDKGPTGEGGGQEAAMRHRRSSSEDNLTDSDRDRGTSDSDRDRNKERLRNRHVQDQEQHWSDVKEPTIWLRLPEKELSSSRSSSNRSSTDGGGSSGGGGGGGGGGGRVSQLLSKFGERPKPPSRSKSSDCFVRPSRGRGERSGTEGSSDDLSPGEEAIAEGKSFRAPGGFPKRSRSFSHRIICARENGLLGVPGYHDGEKPMERKWSDDGRGGEYSERGSKPKVLLRWKHGDKKTNNPADTFERSESVKKKALNDMANRDKAEMPRQGSIGSVPAIMMTQDDGFTMASVKNVEGIGFARKVSIRQEGKERAAAERETKINEKEANRASEKQAAEQEQQGTDIDAAERQLEREKMILREKEWERQIELQIEEKKQRNLWRGEADSKPLLCMCVQSSEIANQLYSPNSPSSIVSAAVDFFDFNRSPTVKDVGFSFDRPERDCAGETQERTQAQAVLSQHTEALISKIGSVREKRTEREGRRLTQTCMYVETNMNDVQDGGATKRSAINSIQPCQNSYAGGSSPQYKDEPVAAPKSPLKSPKRCVSVGQSTDPEDIPIPRTVFFGVDMALSERPVRARIPSTDGPEDGGGGGGGGEAGRKGVERSDSYRAGRPLTRIESLREKIKQHELERQRISKGVEAKESVESNRGEGGGAGGGEADTDTDTITWISSSTTTDGGGVNQDKWRDLAHERAMEERRKMGWSMEDMEEMGGGSESASTMTTVSAVTPAAAAQQWRQEEPSVFDDAQEVSASSRANPQLPVPHSALGALSQSLVAEETQHDSSGSSRGGGGSSRSIYIETSVELFSDHGSEDVEVEQLTQQQQQHVDQLTGAVGLQAWRHQNLAGGGQDRPTRAVGGGEELEDGEGEGEEEEDVDDRGDCHDENYLPPSHTSSSSPASSRSRSPSPLLPLADMSRIYNLKAVGSRAGMCISERPAVEVVSHKPVGRDDYRGFHQKATQESTQDVQGDREKQQPHPWELSDEPLSVTSVQRQVEQLRLREQQEARRQSAAVAEQQQQQFEKSDSKRSQLHHHTDGTSSPRDRASPTGPRTPPAAHRSSAQSTRAFPPSPRLPENARKQLVRPTAPVPPSTPSPSTLSPVTSRTPSPSPSQSQSPSPSASPCLSPSPSPSPPVISIRSAASGPGKRGTTITITPRKSSPVLGTAAAAVAPSAGSGSPVSSRQADPGQAQAQGDANGTGEGGKKRYPTAEEIQVIGGYQNLEKSCLVKSRGTANKGVKVCFDDSQLERVCEYPSESSLLASLPPSPRLGNPADRGRGEEEEKERERRGRGQKQQKEEDEDEDDEESVLGRNVGSARARVLRVDESCKR